MRTASRSTRPVTDAEILAHLDRHSKAVMKDFYRTSEFCAACHKAALPQDAERLQVAARDLAVRRVAELIVCEAVAAAVLCEGLRSTCQTCHMQREALTTGPIRGEERASLLRTAGSGANTSCRRSTASTSRLARIVEFLQNSVFNVDLFALEHGEVAESAGLDGQLVAPLGLTHVYSVRAGRAADGRCRDPEQRHRAQPCAGAARHVRVLGGSSRSRTRRAR